MKHGRRLCMKCEVQNLAGGRHCLVWEGILSRGKLGPNFFPELWHPPNSDTRRWVEAHNWNSGSHRPEWETLGGRVQTNPFSPQFWKIVCSLNNFIFKEYAITSVYLCIMQPFFFQMKSLPLLAFRWLLSTDSPRALPAPFGVEAWYCHQYLAFSEL